MRSKSTGYNEESVVGKATNDNIYWF